MRVCFVIALYNGDPEEGKIVDTVQLPGVRGRNLIYIQIFYPRIPFDPTTESHNVTIEVFAKPLFSGKKIRLKREIITRSSDSTE